MSWYNTLGPQGDIAVSSRVRLARNIKGIPFPSRMTDEAAQAVIQKVWDALQLSSISHSFKLYKIAEQDKAFVQSAIEKHFISPNLASSGHGAVIISDSEDVAIMINEEDHIRIQTFSGGLNVREAYSLADKLDTLLGESIDFDYHDKFGFLTSCPTNAGTGMRASVMLHLPAATMTKSVNRILSWAGKLNLTVRGAFGEGTQAQGNMYQLSNQVTMGVSEDDILNLIESAAKELCLSERKAQSAIYENKHDDIADRCMRAYGILTNAYRLTSNEAMKLASDVHLGINLGIIKNIEICNLTEALFLTMPGSLGLRPTRDVERAEYFRNKIH
ncbi:MAG: protein arginine kinase [Clostridia bacterium]|nr:protein arginine kinase [Clostridia bacterium]